MSKAYKIHSANIYLNGSNFAHVAEEITLPEVKNKTTTHAPTALGYAIDIPLGYEPMSITIKGDFDPAFMAAAADTKHVHKLQIYADLVEYDDSNGRAAEQQVVAYLDVMFTGHKVDAFKHGEASKVEYTASVWNYRLEIEGVEVYKHSVQANKHEVLGVNLNATSNSILNT